MPLDQQPKKPCKFCGLFGHFPYMCRANPKKSLKRSPMKARKPLARSTKLIKRTVLKQQGKHAKQWLITRATWIRKNPPPIRGQFWECYLRIHEWCPVLIDLDHLTLDHVVSRTRDPSLRYKLENLRPACIHCNGMKGSRSLDELKPTA